MSAIDHIGQLTSDPSNRRKHNPRNVGMIASSLGEVGAARSIVIDEDGVILAGNATIEAAAQAGIERVRVIETDGEEIVAVRRIGLTDAQKRRLALADNRTAELAEWDVEQLLADLNAGESFDGLFTDAELDALLADIRTTEPAADPGAQVDRAEELRAKWQTARGDLWLIGPHRLLCGDATNAEDVARLMDGARADLVYTDPPYGVAYEGGTVRRDGLAGDGSPDLYGPAMQRIAEVSNAKAAVYLWHSDSKSAAVSAAVSAAGYDRRCTIIWNKNQAQFGALGAQYKTKHEPCYYLFRRGQSPNWYGPTNEVTVWDVDREGANDYHPTQKPPELAARAITNSSNAGDVVLDLFLGGAATMVAAEQTGRVCYGMEIEPKYVAVCLERLTGMGLEPRRAD